MSDAYIEMAAEEVEDSLKKHIDRLQGGYNVTVDEWHDVLSLVFAALEKEYEVSHG